MSRLGLTRDKIYKTVARQLHGVVPCWVCGQHVLPAAATLLQSWQASLDHPPDPQRLEQLRRSAAIHRELLVPLASLA